MYARILRYLATTLAIAGLAFCPAPAQAQNQQDDGQQNQQDGGQ